MDFKRTKSLIDKFQRLSLMVEANPLSVNVEEKELLLGYLKSLKKQVKKLKTADEDTEVEPKAVPAPKSDETPMSSLSVMDEVDKINAEIQEAFDQTAEEEELIPAEVLEVATVNDIIEQKPTKETLVHSEYQELFDGESEVTYSLANKPIEKISAVIGINEKYLLINELFGGDSSEYNSAIEFIDTANSYQEVQDHIIDKYVTQYNWLSDDNVKKAKRFIQTIQRRFINS